MNSNTRGRGGSSRGGRGGMAREARPPRSSTETSQSSTRKMNNNSKSSVYLQPVNNNRKKQYTYFSELKEAPIPYLYGGELRDLKLKLINIVSASLIKEPRINQLTPTLENIMQYTYQIAHYDPEFIHKLALYTRDELGIRTVANYLICLASVIPTTQPYLKKYFKDMVKLPSDWLELPNIIKNLTNSKTIPKSLRNVMVTKFGDFDVYQLGKYNTEGKIKRNRKKVKQLMSKNPEQAESIKQQWEDSQTASFKQLIRVLHLSKPVVNVMSLLGKKYPATYEEFQRSKLQGEYDPDKAGKRMKLPVPETWETMVSEKGNKANTWEELIDHNKLPFTAMLRNLRNMMISGIQPTHHKWILNKLTDERAIANSKQFPLRFLAAFDSIPKDIHELKKWAEEKKMKINYYPAQDLFQTYREALDTAVKLSTTHNVSPIRGSTVVFCYVDTRPLFADSNAPHPTGEKTSKYSTLENAILLSLMCKYVCEECELYFVGYNESSELIFHPIQSLEFDSILENMKKVKEDLKRVLNNQSMAHQSNVFPTNKILESYLLPRKRMDNLLILSDSVFLPEPRNNILAKYRQDINPDILYVSIDLSGKSSNTAPEGSHENDVYISGFSDSILKFIAERGGSDQQLQYIEQIDVIKKIKNPTNASQQNQASSSNDTEEPVDENELQTQQRQQQKTPLRVEKPWRNARVFISSTFLDMHGERDLLVKYIFPELRERCAKRKIHLTEVDLRWGITEEESSKNKSVEFCLEEVDRCRPFFIGLLGQRYGWVPNLKENVPADPKYDWIRSLPGGYNRSITELEMHYALHHGADKSNCMFYLRDPVFMKEVPAKYKSTFESEDSISSIRLEAFKSHLRSNAPNYNTYQAKWGGEVDGTPCATGLEDLHQKILQDLWERIQTVFPPDQDELDSQFDSIKSELHQHQLYADLKCKNFVGRKDQISCLFKFLDLPRTFASTKATKMVLNKSNSLLVSGKPGSGKSSLIAYFLNQAINESNATLGSKKAAGVTIIQHYVGSTPGSTDIRKALSSLCHQLNQKCRLNETVPVDAEYSELKILFPSLLKKASLKGTNKIIVAIDGLDQLDKANSAHSLDWLPSQVHGNVHLIISSVDADHTLNVLKRRKLPPNEISLSPLEQVDRKLLVRNKLAEYRKKLDETTDNNQMFLLLSKTDAYNPLYLVLCCEELRFFGVFENLTEKIKSLSPTLPKLFDDILDRLERDHGKEIIATILGAIACSRLPLYEEDMLVILARKDERTLPISIWSRIYRSIQPLLQSSLDKNEKGLEFFHNQLKLVVLKRYHGLSESSSRIHKLIANFYLKQSDPEGNQTWKGVDSTSFSELPYHLTKSKQVQLLEQILTNLVFIQKKSKFGLSFELLNDYLEIIGVKDDDTKSSSSSLNKLVKSKESLERFTDFYRFISSNTHILSRSPELTFQQAFNQPHSSYCHQVAAKSISSHKESWVEWLNKPEVRDSCKQTITGIFQGATCVAYSPDSKYIASAGKDSVIHIYKASNGSEVQTLQGHSNWVSSLSFSSDNKSLASASWDDTVIVWDILVGKEIHVFKNHHRAVNSVEFSPKDNNLLLSASWDSSVIIFNVLEKSIFRYLKAHSKPVNHACWSRDGQLVASCSWDGTIKIWNPFEHIAANRLKLVIDQSAYGSIKSCQFSSNSKQIIATTMRNQVLLFDATSAKLLSVIGNHGKSVNHCSISDDGQHFVTSSDDGTIKLWSSQLGNQMTEQKLNFDGWVNCLAFHPKQSILAMGCSDCVVRVFDVSGSIYKEIAKFTGGHTRAISSLSFNSTGDLLASTSEDKQIRVWSLSSKALSYSIVNAHTETVNSLSFSPVEPDTLVSCSDDYQSKVWSKSTLVTTLSGNNNTVKCCTYSPCGKYIATVSRDCSITLFLTASYKQIAKLQGHTDWVNFVSFSPDSKKLVSGGWDFNIRVWSVPNKKELLCIKGHTGSIERGFFSEDKKYIYTCSFDGTVKVWDSEFGTEITTLSHASRISDVVNSTDQSGRIFSCSDDGVVKSWLPVVGKCLTTFTGHSGPIRQSVFSNSGSSSFGSSYASEFSKSIVSASDDGTVKIWDFNNHTNSHAIHNAEISDCAFSSDTKYLVTVGLDNQIRVCDPKKPLVTLKSIPLHYPTSCAFSQSGILLVGTAEGLLYAYDSTKDFASVPTPQITTQKITSITALSSAENVFMIGSWSSSVIMLSIKDSSISNIAVANDWVECVGFSPDNKWLAAGGRDHTLLLIENNLSSKAIQLPCAAASLCFSPDSKEIAIGSFTGELYVFNIAKKSISQIEISQTGTITQLAFLDQHRLVSVSKDRSLIIWNTSTSAIENEFVQNSPITGMSISHNLISTIDTNGNLSLLSYHKSK